MWLHIGMAGPMMAYRFDVTTVLADQMPCRPTNFCLLLLSAVPYFTYFGLIVPWYRLILMNQGNSLFRVASKCFEIKSIKKL